VVVYAGVYAARAPEGYFLACFYLFGGLAWPLAVAAELGRLVDEPRGRPFLYLLWLPALVLLAELLAPRFLLLFPAFVFLLLRALSVVGRRYAGLSPVWVRFPLLLLLMGGLFFLARFLGPEKV